MIKEQDLVSDRFIFHADWFDTIENLSPDQQLNIYRDLAGYAIYGREPITDNGRIFVAFVRKTIDKDLADIDKKQGRSSAAYREWRNKVLIRDGYRCQKCGARNVSMHAHHIKPYADYPELRLDVDNGITLCADCHRDAHRSEFAFLEPRRDENAWWNDQLNKAREFERNHPEYYSDWQAMTKAASAVGICEKAMEKAKSLNIVEAHLKAYEAEKTGIGKQ